MLFSLVLLCYPGVSQNLISIKPLARIDDQQLLDQVLSLIRYLVPIGRRELKLPTGYHVKELSIVVVVKRRKPAKPIQFKFNNYNPFSAESF